jgi:replication initiation and membrane attachment protein DnaB
LTDINIRTGSTRKGYTMVFHELFDLYHPYIGDKALLYYTYLLRYRNNEEGNSDHGYSWKGRKGVVEAFQLSYSTLPLLDGILEASGLVDIERRPCSRGKKKIYYVVNDPLDRETFRQHENNIIVNLQKFYVEKPEIKQLLGKQNRLKITLEK